MNAMSVFVLKRDCVWVDKNRNYGHLQIVKEWSVKYNEQCFALREGTAAYVFPVECVVVRQFELHLI